MYFPCLYRCNSHVCIDVKVKVIEDVDVSINTTASREKVLLANLRHADELQALHHRRGTKVETVERVQNPIVERVKFLDINFASMFRPLAAGGRENSGITGGQLLWAVFMASVV